MTNDFSDIFRAVRATSRHIARLTDAERSAVLQTLADILEADASSLIAANELDLARMDAGSPLYDRLKLTPARISDIASDMRNVAALPCPVGEVVEERVLPNGINLRRVRVPFGVIGVIYEARPNVTFDVFSLCLKSGNACILKGGRDASSSNEYAIQLIHRALSQHGIGSDAAVLLPSTHEATAALLGAVGYVDVCIPRGGRKLIDFVRDNARVPVIETGAGVVHAYIDASADTAIATAVVNNAKTRRVSVCNALDTMLIHSSRLSDLPEICAPIATENVELHVDSRAEAALRGHYPDKLLVSATPDVWPREWMDYKMGICTVDTPDQAIDHITLYGSGHSETIVTEDTAAADRFTAEVDAACVYVNLPTSFTDGAQFGLGAEIGISTQKLGPRGPMGLREITTTRYILTGHGQTRPK